MTTFILSVGALLCFAAGFALARRIVRFIAVVYFDNRVTIRYMSEDGSVAVKRVKVTGDRDIIDAVTDLKSHHD